MRHSLPVRVYYEDTDFSGLVYHASYLRFMERGRTELLRSLGLDQRALHAAEPPIAFAVRRMSVAFARPARMDDALEVETVVAEAGGASLTMDQAVRRGGETLVTARVVIACLRGGRAGRLPQALRAALEARRGDPLAGTGRTEPD